MKGIQKEGFVKALEEGWNRGNLDAFDKFYAPNTVHHRPPLPTFNSLAEEKDSIRGTLSAFTSSKITINEIIAEGNFSTLRYTWQATHTGQSPSLPIPPTGKEITLEGCLIDRWENGKIVEEWEYSDYLGFLQQLGVIPPLG